MTTASHCKMIMLLILCQPKGAFQQTIELLRILSEYYNFPVFNARF